MAATTDFNISIPLAIYVHFPFCRSRCTYCSFNTYTGLTNLIQPYVDSACREITWTGEKGGHPHVHTIYFGGGTPSLMTPTQVAHILDAIAHAFLVVPHPEITLEANPGRINYVYLRDLRQCGVNRLSLGAQSAQETDLHLFNRQHHWRDVEETIEHARRAGFDNINLDLIYGAPGQRLSEWQDTVRQSVALAPDHLSMYSLGLEPGSPLHRWVASGRVEPVDDDLAAEMYLWASDYVEQSGLVQYEISNWARAGFECRHNLQYWYREPYLGIGAGAHGFVDPVRYAAVAKPQSYIHRLAGNALAGTSHPYPLSPAVDMASVEYLTPQEARGEAMMLRLRLTCEGVGKNWFESQFGQSIEHFYARELAHLEKRQLVMVDAERVRLTAEARLLGNYVFRYFV